MVNIKHLTEKHQEILMLIILRRTNRLKKTIHHKMLMKICNQILHMMSERAKLEALLTLKKQELLLQQMHIVHRTHQSVQPFALFQRTQMFGSLKRLSFPLENIIITPVLRIIMLAKEVIYVRITFMSARQDCFPLMSQLKLFPVI